MSILFLKWERTGPFPGALLTVWSLGQGIRHPPWSIPSSRILQLEFNIISSKEPRSSWIPRSTSIVPRCITIKKWANHLGSHIKRFNPEISVSYSWAFIVSKLLSLTKHVSSSVNRWYYITTLLWRWNMIDGYTPYATICILYCSSLLCLVFNKC